MVLKLKGGKTQNTKLYVRSDSAKATLKDTFYSFARNPQKKSEMDLAVKDKLRQMIRKFGPIRFNVVYYSDTIYSTTFQYADKDEDIQHLSLSNNAMVDYDEVVLDKDTLIRGVSIVWVKDPRGRRGGSGEQNDCLYHLLREAFERTRKLPKILRSPENLKEYLHIPRDAKISFDHLPKLEKKLKTNLHVVGSHIYESDKKYPRDLKLRLWNEHFERLYVLDDYKLLTKGYNHGDRCTAYPCFFKKDWDKMTAKICYLEQVHKGNKVVMEVGFNWIADFYKKKPLGIKYFLKEMKRVPRTDEDGKIIRINGKKQKHIPEPEDVIVERIAEYKEFQKGAWENLGGLSKGTLNPTHANGNLRLLATQFWYKTAPPTISQCDPFVVVDEESEEEWIQKAFTGALVWAKKDSKCKHAYEYDVNSEYPYLMKKVDFITRAGKFKCINHLPDLNQKTNQYSIYRCVVSDYDERVFQKSKSNIYYTGIDLKTAKTNGYTIELVQDGRPNKLEYDDHCRMKGKDVFGLFIDSLYKMKKAGVPLSKDVMNTLWGYLISYEVESKENHFDKKGRRSIHIDDLAFLKSYRPSHTDSDGNEVKIITAFNSHDAENGDVRKKIFRFKWCRFAPFLTALARKMMADALRGHEDNLLRVHTDGFIVKKKMKLKIGTDLGDYKLANEGKIKVHHSNWVEWK